MEATQARTDEDAELYRVQACRHCPAGKGREAVLRCWWCDGLGVELVRERSTNPAPVRVPDLAERPLSSLLAGGAGRLPAEVGFCLTAPRSGPRSRRRR